MIARHGEGRTEYGPGVAVELSGDEVAQAIDAYLVAHGIVVRGPRTITVNGEPCDAVRVYVDPSGYVIRHGEKLSGRGPVTCQVCEDTHVMVYRGGMVACTHCPTPCQACRAGGTGAFCARTPCACECHRRRL